MVGNLVDIADDEEEAEYAWLSPGNLKPFQRGDLSGRDDGMESQDRVLRDSISTAHKALKTSEQMLSRWGSDNEDSDGGESKVLKDLICCTHDCGFGDENNCLQVLVRRAIPVDCADYQVLDPLLLRGPAFLAIFALQHSDELFESLRCSLFDSVQLDIQDLLENNIITTYSLQEHHNRMGKQG